VLKEYWECGYGVPMPVPLQIFRRFQLRGTEVEREGKLHDVVERGSGKQGYARSEIDVERLGKRQYTTV
jgi:hypothetical protein